MSAPASLFSYYGGKGRLAPYYPPPYYRMVIEPFAGGASYSALYYNRDIWLNDLDEITVSIWEYLLMNDLDEILIKMPASVERGQKVDEIINVEQEDPGLVHLLRSSCNLGTQGRRGTWNQFTKWGADKYPNLRKSIEYWHPKIRHWKINRGDYRDLNKVRATWFIDPPYNSEAGSGYRTNDLDYEELSAFVLSCPGQVIVCDDAKAEYLPFVPMRKTLSTNAGGKSKGQTMEGVYIQHEGENVTDLYYGKQ